MIPLATTMGRTGERTTWNPNDKGSSCVLSNANLTAGASATDNLSSVRSTTGKSAGKWHFEVTVNAINTGTSRPQFGIVTSSFNISGPLSSTQSIIVLSENSARVTNQASAATPLPDNITAGTVIAVEIDADAKTVSFQVQGGTRQTYSISALSAPFYAATINASDSTITANFGASPFAITPTSGFAPWG